MEWDYRKNTTSRTVPLFPGVRKEIMFTLIALAIVVLGASLATVVVTARDGYRAIPTRDYGRRDSAYSEISSTLVSAR